MLKIIDSRDENIRLKAIEIIQCIVRSGIDGLIEGEQHPYKRQLLEDGTEEKLIRIFVNNDQDNIHKIAAQTIAQLYKGLQLPSEINQDVVESLKPDCLDDLAVIAENQENHNIIMIDDFVIEIFRQKYNILPQLHLILNLLKFGTIQVRKKIAKQLFYKLQKLLKEVYDDNLGANYCYNEQQTIISQVNQALNLIDEYSKMEQSINNYQINEVRYMVQQNFRPIRDVAFHPNLMLIASVSEDGTMSLTDVSHSIISRQDSVSNVKNIQNQTQLKTLSFQIQQSQSIRSIKVFDSKWNYKPARSNTLMNKMQQLDQQGLQQSTINFTQSIPLCVKFLPFLESSNDKSRKQAEMNNQIINIQLNANAIAPKRKFYDLGCLVTGNNQGQITVMALPDPKMQMLDQMKKLEKNKMFEIDAHFDAIWSIDTSNQLSGLFSGYQVPPTGQKLTQTRIASASADGTVKLWNINTEGIPDQTDGNNVVCFKMLQQFKHTPSISSSVIRDWKSHRSQASSTDIQNNNLSINGIEDKLEDSDIPTQVIFDPMNVANLIVGYVSGDLVRFEIEKGEFIQLQVGQRNESERIISLTKSLSATHYQTQDTIPLLVSTNHGYLHIVDPRYFQTLFSYKAINSQGPKQILQQQYSPSNQENSSRIANISRPILDQMGQQRNEIKSPLQSWRDDIKQQYAAQWIFTSSTYLQFDCLIAASTNFGRVFMFDLRMADKGQVGIIGEKSQFSQHQQMFSEGITKIAAHPIHPVLVSAGADGEIKVYSSNPS